MIVRAHSAGRLPAAPLPSARRVSQIVNAVLKKEKAPRSAEINVVFVDNKTIRRLNRKFLDESGNTDVIAFPNDPEPSGDIYISIPVALENAQRYDEAADREIVRLIVHGTLHLLGYSDHGRREKAVMWKKQESFVKSFFKEPR